MRTNQCPWCGRFDSYDNMIFILNEDTGTGHWEHDDHTLRCKTLVNACGDK
jgi:hypothetical protein